jgi:hypothetical protein
MRIRRWGKIARLEIASESGAETRLLMFTVPGHTASRAVLYQSVCNLALAHVARPTEWNFRLSVVDRNLLRKMSFIRCSQQS